MALPKNVRRLAPDRIRHNRRLRALAVGFGVIPPRTMHSPAEAATIARLATGRRRVVEIGVYEGSSAVVLCGALDETGELTLIDPFVDLSGHALPPGWGAAEWATKRVVERARRDRGPTVRWHVAPSAEVGERWSEPVDLVFIDGDHSESACRLDWELWSPHVTRGGAVAFHDATGRRGSPGPTAVVDALFKGADPLPGWAIVDEVDTLVIVERR